MSVRPAPVDRTHAALLVMSFAAGATDAFAFLSLGGIFTANMTGNLILIGLVDREHYRDTLTGAGTAIAAFVAALVLGYRWLRTSRAAASPQRTAAGMLGAVTAIQIAVLVLWLIVGVEPGLAVRCGLIALSAAAVSLQTVAAKGLAGSTGLSTAYLTGTLGSLIQDIVDGKRDAQALRIGAIATLVIGAFAGGLSIHWSDWLGPVLPAIATALALALARAAPPGGEPNDKSRAT